MGANKVWVTRGFEEFRKGTFGNAGQNLYVSQEGILQRIHQFDLTGNGYTDLVFCNSQAQWEQPPSLVYRDALGDRECLELPSYGAVTAAVADLNGDGLDDLILGFRKDGVHTLLNAIVYYGSAAGLSSRYHLQLPAPFCSSATTGDFRGQGKPAIAFLTKSLVRVFYQTSLGFEMKDYVETNIPGDQICAADLDGDGYSDLIVREEKGSVKVYWGGPDGLSLERVDTVLEEVPTSKPENDVAVNFEEYVADASPLPKVLLLSGQPHIYCALPAQAWLVPVLVTRDFGPPLSLAVPRSLAVSAGDINGDGFTDLVFACRDSQEGREYSWIYWGGPDGYSDTRRSSLQTHRACDVALGDLNGNGLHDVVICQNRTHESFTSESLIFRATVQGVAPDPVRLASHDARRVFVARTDSSAKPQIILISNYSDNASDSIQNTIYFGSSEGFSKSDSTDVPGHGSYSVLYADLDDDGHPDLLVANGSEFDPESGVGSYLFRGTPSGISGVPDSIIPTVRVTSVVCADLNRDGYLDLVFTGRYHPYITIFYGGPNGFDKARSEEIRLEKDGTLFERCFGLALADVNRDGWLDIIVTGFGTSRAFVLWGGSKGFSMDNSQSLSVWNGRSIQVADLTGNGYPDLLIAAHKPQFNGPHDSFLSIYWNGPDGIREDRKMMLQVKCANGLSVADFNNDGRLDIFAGAYSDGRERDLESYIYWNREGRGFSHWDRQCLQTHAVCGCMPADFNEDGWIDLAVANHKVRGNHKAYSEVWWNGPAGFSGERTTKLPTVGARGPSLVHPGNIMDRGPEEYYESTPYQLPGETSVLKIEWDADLPQKTWLRAQLRWARSRDALEQTAWQGPSAESSWFEDGSVIETGRGAGPWIQYRLALGALNSGRTPRLHEVRILFAQAD